MNKDHCVTDLGSFAYVLLKNRVNGGLAIGGAAQNESSPLDDGGHPTVLSTWKKVGATAFKALLAQAADELKKSLEPDQQERPPHETLFLPGYNNTWSEAASRYRSICEGLLSGPASLGLCVLFTWPSFGFPVDWILLTCSQSSTTGSSRRRGIDCTSLFKADQSNRPQPSTYSMLYVASFALG